MNEENWKQIKEAPTYWISNHGNVKCTDGEISFINEKYVRLQIAGVEGTFYIKDLVAHHFLENPNNFKFVKQEEENLNHVDNLLFVEENPWKSKWQPITSKAKHIESGEVKEFKTLVKLQSFLSETAASVNKHFINQKPLNGYMIEIDYNQEKIDLLKEKYLKGIEKANKPIEAIENEEIIEYDDIDHAHKSTGLSMIKISKAISNKTQLKNKTWRFKQC